MKPFSLEFIQKQDEKAMEALKKAKSKSKGAKSSLMALDELIKELKEIAKS